MAHLEFSSDKSSLDSNAVSYSSDENFSSCGGHGPSFLTSSSSTSSTSNSGPNTADTTAYSVSTQSCCGISPSSDIDKFYRELSELISSSSSLSMGKKVYDSIHQGNDYSLDLEPHSACMGFKSPSTTSIADDAEYFDCSDDVQSIYTSAQPGGTSVEGDQHASGFVQGDFTASTPFPTPGDSVTTPACGPSSTHHKTSTHYHPYALSHTRTESSIPPGKNPISAFGLAGDDQPVDHQLFVDPCAVPPDLSNQVQAQPQKPLNDDDGDKAPADASQYQLRARTEPRTNNCDGYSGGFSHKSSYTQDNYSYRQSNGGTHYHSPSPTARRRAASDADYRRPDADLSLTDYKGSTKFMAKKMRSRHTFSGFPSGHLASSSGTSTPTGTPQSASTVMNFPYDSYFSVPLAQSPVLFPFPLPATPKKSTISLKSPTKASTRRQKQLSFIHEFNNREADATGFINFYSSDSAVILGAVSPSGQSHRNRSGN